MGDLAVGEWGCEVGDGGRADASGVGGVDEAGGHGNRKVVPVVTVTEPRLESGDLKLHFLNHTSARCGGLSLITHNVAMFCFNETHYWLRARRPV